METINSFWVRKIYRHLFVNSLIDFKHAKLFENDYKTKDGFNYTENKFSYVLWFNEDLMNTSKVTQIPHP